MKLSINPKYIKREIDPITGDNYYYISLKIKTNNIKKDIINKMLVKELIIVEEEEKKASDIFGFPNKMEELFRSGFGKGDL